MRRDLIAAAVVICLLLPASSGITLFFPQTDAGIYSERVKDSVNGPFGEVLFATDQGIAIYADNGWTTLSESSDPSQGLLSRMVLALEYDPDGRLWIGYPGGLQVADGEVGYVTIQDHHMLKNLRINDIARWGDEMWVATGHSGIQRVSGGNWTRYSRNGGNGPGCNEITAMVVDPATDSLILASRGEGIWTVQNRTEPIHFEQIMHGGDRLFLITGIERDPFGGVYLFNRTDILRYTRAEGVSVVLHVDELGELENAINDVAAMPHGMLLVGTDRGLSGWNTSGVQFRYAAKDGLGSNIVRTLFVDAGGRCWFTVPGYIGYLIPPEEHALIAVSPAEYQVTLSDEGVTPPVSRMDTMIPGTHGEAVVPEVLAEAAGPDDRTGEQEPFRLPIEPLVALLNDVTGSITGMQLFPEYAAVQEGEATMDMTFFDDIEKTIKGLFGIKNSGAETFNESGIHGAIDRFVPEGPGMNKSALHQMIDISQSDIEALNRTNSPS